MLESQSEMGNSIREAEHQGREIPNPTKNCDIFVTCSLLRIRNIKSLASAPIDFPVQEYAFPCPPITEMPLQKPARQRAKILGGSTFALLAPLLAAPCGPSAMCFLRPARGFGWLDPRLSRSAITPSAPHTPAHSPEFAETPLRG